MSTKVHLLYQRGEADYDDVEPDILLAADFDIRVVEDKLLNLTAANYERFRQQRESQISKARWHESRMSPLRKAVADLVEVYTQASQQLA